MSKQLYVANWKMQFSFHQAIEFIKKNNDRLNALSRLPEKEIVLCPSFTDLYVIAQLTKDTALRYGAQNVSAHAQGAYTGEVAAASLAQIGCTYCIIGHSETRAVYKAYDIKQKCSHLFAHGITPIICIENIQGDFDTVLDMLAQTTGAQEYIIAYEPIGAIGTGNVPSLTHIQEVFTILHRQCSRYAQPFRLIYGGSVQPDNAAHIMRVAHVDGLLIGNASLAIETFEAIVAQ